jgi:phage terminase large subunit-like protein
LNSANFRFEPTDDGFEIVAFGQGYASMNWPTKKLEELVLGGRLAHCGHPVLRWMAGNVSIETDAADNWKPSKKPSPERIDGIVALVMALAMVQETDDEAMPIIEIDMPPWQ